MATRRMATGTSESYMHHPASDRCWPKIASHFRALGVRKGHLGDSQNSILSVCFLQKQRSYPRIHSRPLALNIG